MTDILLTIIVPVYNTDRYLKRCIESVVSQINNYVEIILVDDGSKDASPGICDEYSEKFDNITTLHKSNGGLSSARNAGLKISKGKYICFLDSDDMLDGHFIEDLFSCKNIDWDIYDFKCCYEKKLGIYYPQGTKEKKLLSTTDYVDKMIRNMVSNQICFRVYKKSLFENLEFPDGRFYEDIATFYKLVFMARTILSVDYEYYIYNLCNDESITKSVRRKNMEDMLLSVNEMCSGLREFCRKNCLDLEYLTNLKINSYIYIALKLLKCKEDTQDLKEMIHSYIISNNVYLKKYKNYDIRKYFVYRILAAIGIL